MKKRPWFELIGFLGPIAIGWFVNRYGVPFWVSAVVIGVFWIALVFYYHLGIENAEEETTLKLLAKVADLRATIRDRNLEIENLSRPPGERSPVYGFKRT